MRYKKIQLENSNEEQNVFIKVKGCVNTHYFRTEYAPCCGGEFSTTTHMTEILNKVFSNTVEGIFTKAKIKVCFYNKNLLEMSVNVIIKDHLNYAYAYDLRYFLKHFDVYTEEIFVKNNYKI